MTKLICHTVGCENFEQVINFDLEADEFYCAPCGQKFTDVTPVTE